MPRRTRAFSAYLAFLLLPLVFSNVFGGTPHLVRDINTTPYPSGSNPRFVGKLGTISLLNAQVGLGKSALVRSDGTADGTFTIRTFNGSGAFGLGSPLGAPMQVGSRLFFSAQEVDTGIELWVTDGTADGTHLVANLASGSNSTLLGFLGEFNGNLVFTASANLGTGTAQLFLTDGTSAGTHQLTNLDKATTGYANTDFAVAAGKIYFTVRDSAANSSLWVSDGTAAGTRAGPSLATLGLNVIPAPLRTLGNRVILIANSIGIGTHLVSIDATTDAVTTLPFSASPGGGPLGASLVTMNGFAYFAGRLAPGNEELWRTDGTLAGTVQVTHINAGGQPGILAPYRLAKVNNRLVFGGNDGTSGAQVWASDGTPGNQTALTALSGITSWDTTAIANTELHVQLLDSGTPTSTVVSTDGTPAGTRVLPQTLDGQPLTLLSIAGDANAEYLRYSSPGPNSSTVYRLFRYTPASATVLTELKSSTTDDLGNLSMSALNGALLFNSTDPARGNELWISDATSTRLLSNVYPDNRTDWSSPDWLTEWNGRAVFTAYEEDHGGELWESDGTEAGTRLLVDLLPGPDSSAPEQLSVLNGALYFFAYDNSRYRFMKLAAPGAAPEILADLSPPPMYPTSSPGPEPCYVGINAVLGKKQYFSAGSDNTGFELWVSDGTAVGTHEVADINAGSGSSAPCGLTVMGDRIYFSAKSGAGIELWATDGTSAGTQQIADLAAGAADSSPLGLAVLGSTLYFEASDGTNKRLWKSDGTAAGTRIVREALDAIPVGVLNGKVLLFETDTTTTTLRYNLWTTDGTAAGTQRIPDVLVTSNGLSLLTSSGFYFANVADENDVEPWISDGTAAGTRRLADLNSSGSSNPLWFAEFSGSILIATSDAQGMTLWLSDSASISPRRLGPAGFPLGPLSPGGKDALIIGPNLIYSGYEDTLGGELYVVPNDRPIVVHDSASASSLQATEINVLSNDTDPDGALNPGTVRLVQTAAHGTVSLSPNGSFSYRPASGYAGTDSFSYTVSDNQGYESPTATVTLTVNAEVAVTGRKGGGGAMGWWEVLALALLLAARGKREKRSARLASFWPVQQRQTWRSH